MWVDSLSKYGRKNERQRWEVRERDFRATGPFFSLEEIIGIPQFHAKMKDKANRYYDIDWGVELRERSIGTVINLSQR